MPARLSSGTRQRTKRLWERAEGSRRIDDRSGWLSPDDRNWLRFRFSRTFDEGGPVPAPSDRASPGKRAPPCRVPGRPGHESAGEPRSSPIGISTGSNRSSCVGRGSGSVMRVASQRFSRVSTVSALSPNVTKSVTNPVKRHRSWVIWDGTTAEIHWKLPTCGDSPACMACKRSGVQIPILHCKCNI